MRDSVIRVVGSGLKSLAPHLYCEAPAEGSSEGAVLKGPGEFLMATMDGELSVEGAVPSKVLNYIATSGHVAVT